MAITCGLGCDGTAAGDLTDRMAGPVVGAIIGGVGVGPTVA
ncbi:putative inner membrane permease of high-affinity phosphate-specific transport system domain protein [Yersinia pestis PY-03]|nr:putative inner membrane permease of high-affinity phosphate-specific transport system domain protein [Yersinia pestis PY-03]